MQGDQQTVCECYLVSICPIVERTTERGPDEPSQAGKKPRGGPPPIVPEALVIHTIASAEPERPHPEAADIVEQVPLAEGRPEHTV